MNTFNTTFLKKVSSFKYSFIVSICTFATSSLSSVLTGKLGIQIVSIPLFLARSKEFIMHSFNSSISSSPISSLFGFTVWII